MKTPQKKLEKNEKVEKKIEGSIPIRLARFHAGVDNDVDRSPETTFSEISDKVGRRAEMWWSYDCLIVLQNGLYTFVPHSDIIFAKVK